jgi:hypothetical protein
MPYDARALEAIVGQYMEVAHAQFLLRFPQQARSGMVNWGTWSNATGLVTAYLTYCASKNPADESIDVVMCFVPSDGTIRFSTDISWSDGEVLSVIQECDIVARDADSLLHEADMTCRSASERIIPELMLLLATDSSDTP